MEIDLGCFQHVDQTIARMCVAHVHLDRLAQLRALLTLRKRGDIDEDAMRDIALTSRMFWQIDMPRSIRTSCFLCNAVLPKQEEFLCKCFSEVQTGTVFECTQENFNILRPLYDPREWPRQIVQRIACKDCGEIVQIPVHAVEARFRQGYLWKPWEHCSECNKANVASRPTQRRSERPSGLLRDKITKVDLARLAAQVNQSIEA